MTSRRTKLAAETDDAFAPGVYLTDGTSLYNVVGELPHEPSLRLVEDCNTLEILMVHVDGLRSPGVRRVFAEDLDELDDADSPSFGGAIDAGEQLQHAGNAHHF